MPAVNTLSSAPAISDNDSTVIGMGEFVVTGDSRAILACIGLGSCIAVCLYDKSTKIGGMVHVVLPDSSSGSSDNPAKYADTAVPMLVNEVVKAGAFRACLVAKLAGGAQMTQAAGLKSTFNTGERNYTQVLAALKKEKIPVAAADTGGTKGRTVRMYLDAGRVTVKCVGGEPRNL